MSSIATFTARSEAGDPSTGTKIFIGMFPSKMACTQNTTSEIATAAKHIFTGYTRAQSLLLMKVKMGFSLPDHCVILLSR